jgi:ribosomal protein L16 Arg81 hydroxylase
MIERRTNVPPAEFLTAYLKGSRPVVLCGMMTDWQAMTRWTPDYLREKCGEVPVEVMAWRSSVAHTEIDNAATMTRMKFGDYISTVMSVGESNEYYMVANNHLFRERRMGVLLDDLGDLPYLAGRSFAPFFWYGPAGTVTPLHYDLCDIMLCQIVGRKLVTLIAPSQTALVYPSLGVFAEVDCERPDLVNHPLYAGVEKDVFVLEPGDCLFLPRSWWHHVKALDVAISVSMTNFRE